MHPEDDNALNTEERIWDLTMQINVKGVWWGCKYAILAMRNNPTDEARGLHTGGSIINTASFVALMGAATPQLACTSFFPTKLSEACERVPRVVAHYPMLACSSGTDIRSCQMHRHCFQGERTQDSRPRAAH